MFSILYPDGHRAYFALKGTEDMRITDHAFVFDRTAIPRCAVCSRPQGEHVTGNERLEDDMTPIDDSTGDESIEQWAERMGKSLAERDGTDGRARVEMTDKPAPAAADAQLTREEIETMDRFYRHLGTDHRIAFFNMVKDAWPRIRAACLKAEGLQRKYHELLYAVENKHSGESRHETALRYILEREAQNNDQRAAIDATKGK